MTYHHLAYLHQISYLVEKDNKYLAAYYSHIAKKISSKHSLHLGSTRFVRCKFCQARLEQVQLRKNKTLHFKCSVCHNGMKTQISTLNTKSSQFLTSQSAQKRENLEKENNSHSDSQKDKTFQ